MIGIAIPIAIPMLAIPLVEVGMGDGIDDAEVKSVVQ